VGKTIFEKLNKGRPPRQSKNDNFELARDLQKLHEWTQHWSKPIVCLRDICHRGPRCMRNRKKAMSLAEILVGHGWLIPNQTHRRDRCEWRVVRGLGGYPTVATMATAPPRPFRCDGASRWRRPELPPLSPARNSGTSCPSRLVVRRFHDPPIRLAAAMPGPPPRAGVFSYQMASPVSYGRRSLFLRGMRDLADFPRALYAREKKYSFRSAKSIFWGAL
jgi:hypothetical protein